MNLTRPLAIVAVVLMLAVTTSSAYIRLSQSGLGCTPWPACQSLARASAGKTASDAPGLLVARGVHRVSASAVLLWVCVLALFVWTSSRRRAQRAASLALPALALLLALLGIYSPSRLPAVTVANLLGGFAMLALAAWLAGSLGAGPATRGPRLRVFVSGALGLLVVQACLGGLIDARGFAGACDAVGVACGSGWPDAKVLRDALDPFRVVPGDAVGHSLAGQALHVLHRATGALVVLFAVLSVRTPAARGARTADHEARERVAVAVTGLLALAVPGSGIAMTAAGAHDVTLAVAHNLLAACLAATLAFRLGAADSGAAPPAPAR